MDYRVIGPSELLALQERKLIEVEHEHARLDLEVRLATIAGIDNESVAQAKAQLVILEVQQAALIAWLEPKAITIEPNDDEEAVECAS